MLKGALGADGHARREESPANPLAWLDIAITLVGCIPIVGDALKTAFRMATRVPTIYFSSRKQARARGGRSRIVGLAFFPPYALKGYDIDGMGWNI